jgi:hypothetical protein
LGSKALAGGKNYDRSDDENANSERHDNNGLHG